ncbi:MAG: muramoyltetrapeptide carboxypeptidase [Myxococcota bacterium]
MTQSAPHPATDAASSVVARLPIRVITPSGGISRAGLTAGVATLTSLGIPCRWDDDALARTGYLAGPDADRADRLMAGLREAGGGLWMARGGYGAIRTLQTLHERGDLDTVEPQPLYGFSDGTVLVAEWLRRGWPAWSAPPLSQFHRLDAPSLARLRAVLHANHLAPFEDLVPVRPGSTVAPLAGGNMCVLASLLGTPFQADLSGKIVLFEDTAEAPYKFDRMWTQLTLSGSLDDVAGIVFGQFTAISDRERKEIGGLIDTLAATLPCPVARGLPVGHDDENALLPMGTATGWQARLEVSSDDAHLAFVRV